MDHGQIVSDSANNDICRMIKNVNNNICNITSHLLGIYNIDNDDYSIMLFLEHIKDMLNLNSMKNLL